MSTAHDTWELFSQTVLEIYFDGILRVDLRHPVEAEARQTLQNLGLGDGFAVVTPCNPGGEPADEADNHGAVERFETELASTRSRFLRADGVSPDESHRERGAAICTGRTAALEIACRYGQAAIFWFDGERFWIVAADTKREPLALPLAAPVNTPSAS